MEFYRLEVVGITYSHSQKGAYTLLLESKQKRVKIPIVIGAFEAQAIALAIEKDFIPKRPLTHELFHEFLNEFSIKISSVWIYQLLEGVFYTYIFCEHNNKEKKIQSRVSDAVALAIRSNAPIFATNSILDAAGVEIEINPFVDETQDEEMKEYASELENDVDIFEIFEQLNLSNESSNVLEGFSVSELKENLEQALKKEDFEFAALLRDELNRRTKSE